MTLINHESVLNVNEDNFDDIALEVFRYQYQNNALYRQYCDALKTNAGAVHDTLQIPFLPISFFKTHAVYTRSIDHPNHENSPLRFESSGTTGENTSRHFVADPIIYEQSLLSGFRQFYGSPAEYAILALLPSYLERKNASLVHMAKVLMEQSGHADNGFYIDEWELLAEKITRLEKTGQKILLLGVTFALLDFADSYPMKLEHTIVMETGGMKGRREELTRNEVHALLKKQWQLNEVHSEYGMTELLSQAYALKDGLFRATSTMKVFVRDIHDPLDVTAAGTGAVNIIDLANINSCAFIATEDMATIYEDGSFEVLGRMDHSILRGCSMMAV
jgi:hypothetical protein